MTEVLPSFAHFQGGRSAFGQIPDSIDAHWQQQFASQLPMISAQWSQAPQLSGIHEFDLSMLHQESQGYMHPQYSSSSMVSPNLAYAGSDFDTAGTPSTSGFPEVGDSFASSQTQHLYPPQRNSGSSYSPRSSYAGVSPRQMPLPSPQPSYADARPGMGIRTTSAPEHGDFKSATSSFSASGIKNLRNSDDEDDDYMPNEDPKQKHGSRKRQRIPHTAVERRYRENLNAHLDKLRQAVPTLAARKGPDGKGLESGHGVKPSKCEVLNGAIEHIGALGKENGDLRSENQALRERVEQMQNWYRANSR